MNSNQDIPALIEQLQHKSSPKRRAAAKKIREIAANEAGPALLAALKRELNDRRTWETQYQMIMALGESGYSESLDYLLQLAEQEFEATTVYVALGDAITILEQLKNHSFDSLSIWIDDDRKYLAEGGIRSLASNQLTPDNTLISKIIEYANKPDNENMDFWVAAASPNWPASLTKDFLNHCLEKSALDETKKAAKAALNGKYLNWNPL